MAVTGVSYRRVNGNLEPIDIVKGGTVMAARNTKLSTRKETDNTKILENAMENAVSYKDGVVSANKLNILTDEDVANVMHPDTIGNQGYDTVTNPYHYTAGRKYEPRKVIMDWELNFYLGNVVKYISRAGRKGDEVADLMKAKQYLEWEIERLTEKEDN